MYIQYDIVYTISVLEMGKRSLKGNGRSESQIFRIDVKTKSIIKNLKENGVNVSDFIRKAMIFYYMYYFEKSIQITEESFEKFEHNLFSYLNKKDIQKYINTRTEDQK